MSIPEFHRFFRPLLELLKDKQPRKNQNIVEEMTQVFHLTPAELQELIPSGSRTRVADRVTWGLTYLRQAKLVESTARGVSRITDRGLSFLATAPTEISPAGLMQFPEFEAFQRRDKPKSTASVPTAPVPMPQTATPGEQMDAAYAQLSAALAEDVLERAKTMSPAFFEKLVVDLMRRLGYGGTNEDAGLVIGQSGDGGVDGVISQDKLGLDKIYLQAKRWKNGTVGRPEVQSFVGALSGQHAAKGVFITTSAFTKDATAYAAGLANHKVILIDGHELSRLMVEVGLGVAVEKRYEIKRVDSDYFTEDLDG